MTDSERAFIALQAIFDGRDPKTHFPEILLTLDHVVTAALIVAMDQDHRKALLMLHEGLVPGVEERIAHGQARKRS